MGYPLTWHGILNQIDRAMKVLFVTCLCVCVCANVSVFIQNYCALTLQQKMTTQQIASTGKRREVFSMVNCKEF